MSPYRIAETPEPIDIYIEPLPLRRRPVLTQLRILALVACALPAMQTVTSCFEQPAQLAAAAGYEAQQMRCVEQYADRKSIDKCRDRVKAAWLLDSVKDAGVDVANVGFDNDEGKR